MSNGHGISQKEGHAQEVDGVLATLIPTVSSWLHVDVSLRVAELCTEEQDREMTMEAVAAEGDSVSVSEIFWSH